MGPNSSRSINKLSGTILSSNRSIFDKYAGINSSDLTIKEINNIRPCVFKMISETNSDDIYIKTHESWELNSLREPIFPRKVSKGVIYIIRNPLDIVVSLAFHSNKAIIESIESLNNNDFHLSDTSTKLNYQLPQKVSSWSAHIESWLSKSKLPYHIMKYEDMLTKPFLSFNEAIRFLNLNYSDSDIMKAVHNSSFDIVQKQEELMGFNEKPITSPIFFRNGTSGQWKYHLNSNQIELIKDCNSKMMKYFGYI